jgi:hypothetical protein
MGVAELPEGDWYCDRCVYARKPGCAEKAAAIKCVLCPYKGTDVVFRRTEEGEWAHSRRCEPICFYCDVTLRPFRSARAQHSSIHARMIRQLSNAMQYISSLSSVIVSSTNKISGVCDVGARGRLR